MTGYGLASYDRSSYITSEKWRCCQLSGSPHIHCQHQCIRPACHSHLNKMNTVLWTSAWEPSQSNMWPQPHRSICTEKLLERKGFQFPAMYCHCSFLIKISAQAGTKGQKKKKKRGRDFCGKAFYTNACKEKSQQSLGLKTTSTQTKAVRDQSCCS